MRANSLLVGVFIVVAAVAGLAACEQLDVDRTFAGPYHVRFTDTTLTYKESYSKPISIRVHNAGPQLDQPITVNYTVSGTAREGRDYSIVGTKGTVVIPAKQSFGEIQVRLINNANNILESQNVVFTLTGVQPSTLQVGFGQEKKIGKQLTLTIQDDCLLSGFYTGVNRIQNQTISVPDVQITSIDCRSYRLSNWNLGLLYYNAFKPTLTFIDNGDNSLTIPAQANEYLGSRDTIRGNGSWNPRDRQITLNLQLRLRRTIAGTQRDTVVVFNQAQTYIPQ
ncbi:hypothetical protein GCM10023187_10910 [Nibrella viscosa]|uniref:Calx-beta domain-containing protein n=1 Tax=Nibrella viscosa TaxID=1084524 RepID=A0ABP8K1H7_9BACT